jgi:peptide/nickel transport system permease protein
VAIPWRPSEDSPAAAPVAVVGDPVGMRDRTRAPSVRLGIGFWLSVGWITLVVLAAIFASVLPIRSPTATNAVERLMAPGSHGYLLGSDTLGRDVLSRLIYGSRVSLVVGASSVIIGVVVGATIGMVAGYVRGTVEQVVMWALDVILSFPALVLLIAVVAFAGHSLRTIALVLGFIGIPIYARLARAHTLAVADREFVLAARAIGVRTSRILLRDIVPNVMPAVMSYGLISVGAVIVVEGSLSFLGLSVSAPTASWGGLIAEGQPFLQQDPSFVLIPSLVMCLTVLSLNLAMRRRHEASGRSR